MTLRESAPKVILGITGGIAAYKSAELARLLIKSGMDVIPIMTEWATRFLGPLTIETLCGHRAYIDTPTGHNAAEIEHISQMRRADVMVIAPLTANTLGKMANGLADNFLTTSYLAYQGPVLVAPAMNSAMLSHPATVRNLELLGKDGVQMVFGEAGELACKEVGAGRMAEPHLILEAITHLLAPKIEALRNRPILVSAGPTCEDLDPVRYLTNRSSGKMGLAVAQALHHAGAKVTLVHGPIAQKIPSGMEVISVRTAAEMATAVLNLQLSMDAIVMAAAVADYRPVYHEHKLKKGHFTGKLTLERTTDILAELGKNKPAHQHLIGFAAESQALVDNAKDKLTRKNLSLIFANPIDEKHSGFGVDVNQVLAIDKSGTITDLGKASKTEIAQKMVRLIAECFNQPHKT